MSVIYDNFMALVDRLMNTSPIENLIIFAICCVLLGFFSKGMLCFIDKYYPEAKDGLEDKKP